MIDTSTDVKTTIIYRESCTHCNEITESKILYAGPKEVLKIWRVGKQYVTVIEGHFWPTCLSLKNAPETIKNANFDISKKF